MSKIGSNNGIDLSGKEQHDFKHNKSKKHNHPFLSAPIPFRLSIKKVQACPNGKCRPQRGL